MESRVEVYLLHGIFIIAGFLLIVFLVGYYLRYYEELTTSYKSYFKDKRHARMCLIPFYIYIETIVNKWNYRFNAR